MSLSLLLSLANKPTHRMTKYVGEISFQAIAEKSVKILGGYFLPHPVYKMRTKAFACVFLFPVFMCWFGCSCLT